MQRSTIVIRSALLATVLAGLACARNKTSDNDIGAARDSSTAAVTDTARMSRPNTSMTDSARAVTPDSAHSVTPKGDTIKPAVDTSTTAR
jgi:hypothetical protein